MTRLSALLLAATGFIGAMVGAMFDSVRYPGPVVVLGAGAGVAVGVLMLLQLRRCDPFGLVRSHKR